MLEGGSYRDAGTATGNQLLVVAQPFRVEVVPSSLRWNDPVG